MRIWRCEVLQDEGDPKIYVGIQATHKWQAQLIAFIIDGGIGEEPDPMMDIQGASSLAGNYVTAMPMNPAKEERI